MTKIKNVRPGILIIADAGLKLAPGESRDVDELTPQTKQALDDGLLVQMDSEEAKSKAKPVSRTGDSAAGKEPGKTEAAGAKKEQTSASDGDPDKTGEQSEPGKRKEAKPKQVVEAESGDQ